MRIADRERRPRPVRLAPVRARAEGVDRRRRPPASAPPRPAPPSQHQRHRGLDHRLRAEARHARICLRDPRHHHARELQRRRQPHRQRATRRAPASSRSPSRPRTTRAPSCRPPATARSRATACSTCAGRRGSPSATACGTACASTGGWRARCSARSSVAATTAFTGPSRVDLRTRGGRHAKASANADEAAISFKLAPALARASAPCERSRSFANSAHGW